MASGGGADDSRRQLLELAAERLAGAADARKAGGAGSNYDYVKVKVRLGAHLEHYYILSRFLLSRMLTVIALPQHKAVRTALDVKKHLVDHGRLDITQEELEEVLFALLRQRGFGGEYVRRYQMVTRFFQQKRPLIILIAGSACTGKSSLAQSLASRLNMPNVLQTDVLYELLRASGAGDLPAEPLWRRALPPGTSLAAEFQRECGTIRRALDGDLCKCIRDGKSIIIEGLHLDPGLFLREFGDPRGSGVTLSQAYSLDYSAAAGATAPGAAEATEGAAPGAAEAVEAVDAAAEQLAGLAVGDAAQQPGAAATAAAVQATAPQQQQLQAVAAAAVRRTASFGDAVPSLSYGGKHRQQSPWKDAASSKSLARPRSARPGEGLDLGQAVFMLRSTDSSSSGGGSSSEACSAPPVPSPRLAACISLPTVREDGPPPLSLGGGDDWQEAMAQAWSAQQLPPAAADATGVSASAGSAQLPAECMRQAEVEAAARSAEPQQHSSVAAADAAAAAAAGTGPVFVPICLAVPEEEYEEMLQDWLARQQAAAGVAGSEWNDAAAAEAACRLRQLQEHLRQYAAAGVPVVELSLSDMGAALDSTHAYVLQCIALALGEEPAAAAP